MIFIDKAHKDQLLKVLKEEFVTVIPNSNEAVLSKRPAPVSKSTLIRCLIKVTNRVWIVRHGLKERDAAHLAKNVRLVANPANRVDIALMIPTEQVEIFQTKIYRPYTTIFPMFLDVFGSVSTR